MYDMDATANRLIRKLMDNGFDAWLAGGSVRDMCLGIQTDDQDIISNARPEQVKKIFSNLEFDMSAAKYGTVNTKINGKNYDFTAIHKDGAYIDGRHPSYVDFNAIIGEDMERRDFTINAMAYSLSSGLFDIFNARDDLFRFKVIRCVNDVAESSFSDDSLRILRALRFAATLPGGFIIEKRTEDAAFSCAPLIKNLSKTRIAYEFSRLIVGKYAHSVLTRYRDVLCEVLPKNLFYEGIMNVSCDLATRLAVLYYRCQDELFKLPIQRRDILNASVLINDLSFDARAIIKKFGVHGAFRVVEFRRAIGYDTFALEGGIENALESGTCFTLSDLKINGHDLLEIGVPA
ncbi:MAG: hypothetical protein RSA70_06050, partial [Clostridia bacterium]